MANQTKVTKVYTANTGVANTFSWSGGFEVFKSTEVDVYLDDVPLTYTSTTINEGATPREYSVDIAAKTIHIGGADLTTGTIIIQADTDVSNARAVYQGGSSISSGDLNANQTQLLRKLSENDLSDSTSFTTGDEAPSNPSDGDIWYDSVGGRSYVYFVDVDSGQWVESAPPFDVEGETTPAGINYTHSTAALAQVRTLQSKLEDIIHVRDFGAVGDGSYDDTTAIQNAINYCTSEAGRSCALHFGAGTFKITSPIILDASNRAISLIGDHGGSRQQGSVYPTTMLEWHGGATEMFTLRSTFWNFKDFGVINKGSGTDAFRTVSSAGTGMHHVFDNISFCVGTGSDTQWSRSAIRSEGNGFGYTTIKNCEINTPAPKFLDYNGMSTSNGVTPLLIYNNHISASSDGGNFTFLYTEGENFDIITFEENTCDQHGDAQLLLFDSATGALTGHSGVCTSFNFLRNELDCNATTGTHRLFKFAYCKNIRFTGNQMQCGGNLTACADLVHSIVTEFSGNELTRCGGPFFSADTNSSVNAAVNYWDVTNTRGLVAGPSGIGSSPDFSTAAASGLIPVTYGATCIIKGHLGPSTGVSIYNITPTNTDAFSIVMAEITDSSNQSFMTRGQIFGIRIANASGGTLGTITQSSAFETDGTIDSDKPANGKNRTFFFVHDGAKAYEISRTAGDVDN